MVRGRKANLDLPLTPALIQQREFREKRANQIVRPYSHLYIIQEALPSKAILVQRTDPSRNRYKMTTPNSRSKTPSCNLTIPNSRISSVIWKRRCDGRSARCTLWDERLSD